MIIERNKDGSYSGFQLINGRPTVVEGKSRAEVMRIAWCETSTNPAQ